MSLEFATNKELVEELMKRTTFVGIVVCSEKESKLDEIHDIWELYTSLNLDQTKVVLEHTFEQIGEK